MSLPNGHRRDALLLSGALGMGHEVTAQVCAASLEARGWSTQTLDAMRLLGRRAGGAGEKVFRSMFAVPGLYDAFHFAALRPGSRLALLADAAARRQLVPRLAEHLDAHPAELVISVFATGASAISALAGRYPGLTHVVFCRDATPHRLWVHPDVDLYLVTSPVAEAAVRRFQPRAAVRIVPSPARPAFYDAPAQPEARARLGIADHTVCVLLMSGGWGLGPVAEAAAALGDAGVQVLAVAGRNAALEAALRAVQERQPRVRAFGFTDRVAELMAAADLVLTSPGDTCTEARAVGRPLLVLDIVPGHGRDNLQHELELGHARVTSAGSEAVVANALAALAASGAGAASGARSASRPAAAGPRQWEEAFSAALAAAGLDEAAGRDRPGAPSGPVRRLPGHPGYRARARASAAMPWPQPDIWPAGRYEVPLPA
jgi:processive 1,2-diacylglycerol beta-glucosyltransferase